MKIDTVNAQYTRLQPRIKKARDTIAGQEAIHRGGTKYLPVPKSYEGDAEATSTLIEDSPWYGATGRTLAGLWGMVFRKPLTAEYPAAMQSIVDDMTLSRDGSQTLQMFAMRLVEEQLSVGLFGVLIEYPQVAAQPTTLAEATAMNQRPYCATYTAEQILNFRYDRVNNASQLVMVSLLETVTEWTSATESKDVQQVRVCTLEPVADRIGYVQRVYRKPDGVTDTSVGWIQVGDDIVPLRNGRPLDFIPFVGLTPESVSLISEGPPLIDLMDVNISHYRTTAWHRNGAMYTGLPTPMFAGFEFDPSAPFALGSRGGYSTSNPDAKWGFLEFEGKGLDTLKEIIEREEAQMAALGARMLAADKRAAEAEGTVRLRTSGESAVLSSMAYVASQALTRILQIMADWQGIAGPISAKLNQDYFEAGMSAQELTAMVAAWQAGAISHQTLFHNLQTGELTEEGLTFEVEQERIQSAPPPAPTRTV